MKKKINIIKKIIKYIVKIIPSYNIKKVSENEIIELLTKIRPVKTNHDLIRIGGENDGGYLLPNDFQNIVGVFSPGVGKLSNFEEYFANINVKVYMADYSVEGPIIKNSNFIFLKKFVGGIDSENFITLDTWVKNEGLLNRGDLILQMDIEGFEYESILNSSHELLNQFRIIIIEFHYLDKIFDDLIFKFYSTVFNKLCFNHKCIHIHPNNCLDVVKIGNIEIPPVMEFTFLRNDRIESFQNEINFPNPLDTPSFPLKKEVVLPKIWYK